MGSAESGWLCDVYLLVGRLLHRDVRDNLLLECHHVGQLVRGEILEAVAIKINHL